MNNKMIYIFFHKCFSIVISAVLLLIMGQVMAASHSEAPNITRMPKVDATDYYLFNSYESGRGQYATMLANYRPLQAPLAGPNYFSMDPTARYDLHIDNNADGQADITFRFEFQHQLANLTIGVNEESGSAATRTIPLKLIGPISSTGGTVNPNSLNFLETYSLSIIKGGSITQVSNTKDGGTAFTKPMDFIGEKTFASVGNYEQYVQQYIYDFSVSDCAVPGKVFVGQRQESFSIDLGGVFDLVNLVPVPVGVLTQFPGGDPGIVNDPAKNTLSGFNITTIALEYPIQCLTNGDSVIGGWTTASVPTTRTLDPLAPFAATATLSTEFTQVSRLGSPLINELIIGIESKDRFNASQPHNDADASVGYAAEVTNPAFPHIINALFLDAVNQGLGLSGDQKIGSLAPANSGRGDLVTTFLTGIPAFTKPSSGSNTLSEMLRLNTAIPATPAASQDPDGALARDASGQFTPDASGYPNGRRPGDDVVDITLRLAMGALCAADIQALLQSTGQSSFSCSTTDAPVAGVEFLDGSPIKATDFQQSFPYLNTPLKGNR